MHLLNDSSFKVVHGNECPCRHAPDVLTLMQTPNTQLSTGVVEFTMMATSEYNVATKQPHKRKRNA